MKRRKRLEMEASDDRIELAFISKVQHGISTNNIAKQMGVSTRTVQRWLALRKNKDSRYWSGQSNTRVRKRTFGDAFKCRIVTLHEELPSRSATTIHRMLREESGDKTPSVQTIRRYLRESGLSRAKSYRDKNYLVFEREAANDLWQIDFKGWDLVGFLGKLHLLAILDDRSRFIIGARWFMTDRDDHVLQLLRSSFEKHGLPNQILSDNGSQFKNPVGTTNNTRYARLMLALGVKPVYHRARHPQSKGKLERWFGFVDSSFMPDARKQVDEHPGFSVSDFNKLFDRWVDWYNNDHHHASLEGKTPAAVFSTDPRKVVRPLQADIDWNKWVLKQDVRKVTKQGLVRVNGNKFALPDGFAGRLVEIQHRPGEIQVIHDHDVVSKFAIPSEGPGNEAISRQINKDGYLKFHKRAYKIGTKHAHKIVHVLVTKDDKEMQVFEGDRILVQFAVDEGKPY